MKKILFSILGFIVTIFTTGCSPIVSKYRVTVEAITAPSVTVAPKTYVIKALGKDSNENSLKFQKQAQALNEALQEEGYSNVDNPLIAQQIIYFDYGIEKIAEEIHAYSEPEVTVGVSYGYGYYNPYYTPFWSDIGYGSYRTYRKKYNYYNRYMTLLSKDKNEKELWRIDVSSIGESKNLKKIVPLLIKTSMPYIAKNTEVPVKIVVEEKRAKSE